MIRILPPWPEDRLADALFDHAKTAAKVAALCWFLGMIGGFISIWGD